MFYGRPQQFRSARLKERRRRARLLRAGVVSMAVAALVGTSVWAARLPSLAVVSVEVRGTETVQPGDVERVVREQIAGSYLAVYPKSNTVLLPAREVSAAVLAAFPRAHAAHVARVGTSGVTVTIEERTPYALWCGAERRGNGEPTGCYFLDDSGFIFTEAPDFSGDVFFRYFGTVSEGPVNANFLTPAEFTELDLFVRSARDLGVHPVSLAVLGEPDAEMVLADESRVLFNRTVNLSDVLQNLKSVLESDVFRAQGSIKLDYVDLRFGNKIFYKFK